MAGTPIVVNMTGGLQFQVGDWWYDLEDFSDQDLLNKVAKNSYKNDITKFFGVPLWPETRSCVGSQQIPYIYEDRVSQNSIAKALLELYKNGREKNRARGALGSEWAKREFSMSQMIGSWDKILSNIQKKDEKTVRSISI
jgi:hypothetical protein